MLHRIVVAGNDTELENALRGAAQKNHEIARLPKKKPLPANTVALVGSANDADAIIRAASTLGQYHDALLAFLAEAIDAREGLVTGASARLLDHATRFAQAVALNADDTLVLERGALLHDLGKLRLSNDVLLKKNLLTYDEWALIRSHTTIGADLAASILGLADIAPVLRNHHENFDGTGYPDQLEGNAIPYLARIMKLLDVYCSMTSPRHYRQTVSTHENALDFIRAERGKHFDPDLVDIFIDQNIGKTG